MNNSELLLNTRTFGTNNHAFVRSISSPAIVFSIVSQLLHLKFAEVRNAIEHVASAFIVLYFIEAHSWRDLPVVMPFTVKCRLCSKTFRTGSSLRKHFNLKHHRSNIGRARFQDDSGIPVEEPKAVALVNEEREYLEWLGVLVERINASLVPDHPGT